MKLAQWLGKSPYALALSSSFFGFYAHCGVAAALYEQKLYPARLSGSSSGGLVAAALAAGFSPVELASFCFELKREDFWDPGPGLGLLKGKKFARLLEGILPSRFEDLPLPLELTVFDILRGKTIFLDKGPLVPAVVATCAVPFLFRPVRLSTSLYWDGGIFEKPGFRPHHPREHVLCSFLEAGGPAAAYEAKTNFRRFQGPQKALRLHRLPAVSPRRLHLGKDAYSEAYARTKEALLQSARISVISA